MKILWVGNIILPKIYEIKNLENKNFVGGWLEGMSEALLKLENVELIYCYPNYENKQVLEAKRANFSSYGIPMTYIEATKNLDSNSNSIKIFKAILDSKKPDIIHFWGTEFLYSLEFFKIAKKCGYINRCIVSIQGLVGYYANHFEADIPYNVFNSFTLSELKGHCSLKALKKSYIFRGKKETELLKEIKHVIGRTSWDKACVKLINPDVKYYKCNESLREVFYTDSWDYEHCYPYQIFISQASYPIKGFHKVLNAVNLIKDVYPNLKIKVAGQNIFKGNFVKGNTYGNYIKKLINRYSLEKQVIFLDMLSAEEMKRELLKSNLFICPSSIENSPNSLGEAMLLGVPCIASDVGGCGDMLKNNIEGYVYPFNESYKLAYYIKKVFDNPELALKLGMNASNRAKLTHNRDINNNVLYTIYESLLTND